jgi:hypothetical protein
MAGKGNKDVLRRLKGAVGEAAALTAEVTALTTLTTADSNGGDYALSALTTTTPYGFADSDEATTFVFVVINNQARIAALETRVQEIEDILQSMTVLA